MKKGMLYEILQSHLDINTEFPCVLARKFIKTIWDGELSQEALDLMFERDSPQVLSFPVQNYDTSGLQYIAEICREKKVCPLPILEINPDDLAKLIKTDISSTWLVLQLKELHKLSTFAAQIPHTFQKFLTVIGLEGSERKSVIELAKQHQFSGYFEL